MASSYFTRYLAGETQRVWAEISPLVYSDLPPETRRDVQQVCDETMRRVRLNAERLVHALTRIGFQFGVYPDGMRMSGFYAPLEEPDPEIEPQIAGLESALGPLPLTLQTFWRRVGSICFIGRYPNWPDGADPLVVFPVQDTLFELENWQFGVEEEGIEAMGPFRAVIAPDDLHKDNVSGGDWYGIELPCGIVDAVLTVEPHETTFINYLRLAIQAQGFPGAKQVPDVLAKVGVELVAF